MPKSFLFTGVIDGPKIKQPFFALDNYISLDVNSSFGKYSSIGLLNG